jgi:hypothetical protein
MNRRQEQEEREAEPVGYLALVLHYAQALHLAVGESILSRELWGSLAEGLAAEAEGS